MAKLAGGEENIGSPVVGSVGKRLGSVTIWSATKKERRHKTPFIYRFKNIKHHMNFMKNCPSVTLYFMKNSFSDVSRK